MQYALMNEVEKLRDAREQCDVALTECPHPTRSPAFPVERIEEDDAGSYRERQQQVRHLRQGVEEREHAQQRIARPQADELEDRVTLRHQIAVREHDPLGVARGAGGVEDDGSVGFRCGRRCKGSGARGGNDRFELRIRDAARFALECQQAVLGRAARKLAVECNDLNASLLCGRFGEREVARVHEQERGTAILQQLGDLVGLESGIEGHGSVAAGENAEIRRYPAWAVVGQNGAAAAGHRRCRQMNCNCFRHGPQFGIAVAVQRPALALELDRGVLREALSRLPEALVEIRHLNR